MHDRKMKKYIYNVTVLLFSLFLILIGYITYLQSFKSADLANNPLNMRAMQIEKHIQRGMILDRNGEKIAYSKKNEQGTFSRIYPFHDITASISGYVGDKIGSAGIEGYANTDLVGMNSPLAKFGPIQQLFNKDTGNTVKLTVDTKIQKAAYDALGNQKGAIVILNAKTGAILAMVSKPSFDPNTINQNWDQLRSDANSPLLNRASQGLYPPGSILKTMIADAALKENVTTTKEIFSCPGFLKIDDTYTLYENANEVHGNVTLEEALDESCNVTFATLALRLGEAKLADTFERFGFSKTFNNEIDEAKIHLPEFKKLSDGEIAQVGIGQSTVLVTPLRMALLASAFMNNGTIMKPYLIDEILSPDGVVLKKTSTEKWLEATTAQRADTIESFMKSVVKHGTATRAAVSGIDVAGKTGTAENSSGDSHAWFIGSAALPSQDIAFAIIVENGDLGGLAAAPIAKRIITNILHTEEVTQ